MFPLTPRTRLSYVVNIMAVDGVALQAARACRLASAVMQLKSCIISVSAPEGTDAWPLYVWYKTI